MIGKVLSCESGTYIIRFTVPLYIEDAEAIPLNSWDKAEPGDEVYIIEGEDLFAGHYSYTKMGTRDKDIHRMHTDKLDIELNEAKDTLKLNFSDKFKLNIDISNNKISIEMGGGDVTLDVDKIHLGNKGNQPLVMFNEYEKRFKDLYLALSTHTHGTAMGPSSPPLPPELPKFSSVFPSTLRNDKSSSVDAMK